MNKKFSKNTSWESVSKWYDHYLSDDGHYFHREIILPRLKNILSLKEGHSLIDLGCGQGILSRQMPKGIPYLGVDSSPDLIKQAKQRSKEALHQFMVADATEPLKIDRRFSHGTIILALQNMKDPQKVLTNMGKRIEKGGELVIVLNHPCYRIPRQSSWVYDESKKMQYRRVDHYMSPLEIPIQMKPSIGKKSPMTYSYHSSLSKLSKHLRESGFCILEIDEWCSEKTSEGKRAKAENRCRKEFPLFLTLVCKNIG